MDNEEYIIFEEMAEVYRDEQRIELELDYIRKGE